MSDFSMYELEDIVWDEFDRSDDHIVPHPSNDDGSGHSYQVESCKKPRREVTGVSNNAGNLRDSNCVSQGKEERDSTTLTERNMLEKDLWSHTPDGVFAASCDGNKVKEATSLASDDTRTSSTCFKSSNITFIGSEFCDDDRVLNDSSTAVDSNPYDYPLSQISQTDDLNFFDDDCEDKESSDLLYYNWPDIGNFEDVDRMLRSCDSSLGLGVGNEDEMSWFSSAGPIGGSEEALKSDFKFPYPQSSALKSTSVDCEAPKQNNKRSNYTSESKDGLKPKEQKKQSKNQNRREGFRKGQCLDNGGSMYHIHDVPTNGNHLSSMDTSRQVLSSTGNQHQKLNLELDFEYLQTSIPYPHTDYGRASDQTTVGPMLSCIKSENKILTSLSPKESSFASNQMHSMETSGDPPSQGTAIELDGKREKVHQPRGSQFTSTPRHVGMVVQADPVSVQTQVHLAAKEVESQSDVEKVRIGALPEFGSLNVQESSSMNSGLDEISFEATSFRQLQQVMEQLDLRTKLCIRDSLYRLARSAEQRHNYANLSSSCTDCGDSGGVLMDEGTTKCTGFMDIETDTNPIDRSIAHLLFHRPSESPGMAAQTTWPLKSNTMIHGSISSQPMVAGKLVHDEAAAESDDKIADD